MLKIRGQKLRGGAPNATPSLFRVKIIHCTEIHVKFYVASQNKKQYIFILNNIFVISGEKPYKCNHCSSSFAQRTSLNVHFNSHHKGLQPLSSPIKGKLFKKLQRPKNVQSSNYCFCLKLDVFLNSAAFTIVQDIMFNPHLIFLELTFKFFCIF